MLARITGFALIVLACAGASGSAHAQDPQHLAVLARVGPWPVISQMIAYRGRLWFANSVKGVNHNSADLWSLDPEARDVRYERHLFSQDAGDPLIHDGLLYWPYEDSRASVGWGAFEVTDGEKWRYLTVPSAQMFHIHLAVEWHGDLMAVSSAWRAGLQLSDDGGRTWTQAYDHPTPERLVSRMSELAVAGDVAIGRMREPGKHYRLVRWDGKTLEDVPGRTQGKYVYALTAHRGRVYFGFADSGGDRIGVVDGDRVHVLVPPAAGWRLRDLASDGEHLWALGRTNGGGKIWSSTDGEEWTLTATLSGGTPSSIAASGGGIYVGGSGEDGKGMLWGMLPGKPNVPSFGDPPALPERQHLEQAADFSALSARLDEALAQWQSYHQRGRPELRGLIYRIALSDPPADLLASKLTNDLPQVPIPVFGGSRTVASENIGRWLLLWGMGLSGKGHVPTDLLARNWTVPSHGSEKYFDPLLMALWTVSQTGQNDAETIAALIARLGRKDDPLWITGDAVGALSAVTGQRFGYNIQAWRTWWRARGQ